MAQCLKVGGNCEIMKSLEQIMADEIALNVDKQILSDFKAAKKKLKQMSKKEPLTKEQKKIIKEAKKLHQKLIETKLSLIREKVKNIFPYVNVFCSQEKELLAGGPFMIEIKEYNNFNFEDLEKLSKEFKTKNINFTHATEFGYYDEHDSIVTLTVSNYKLENE